MNSRRTNIWLCKAFALAFILNVLGIGKSHALYSPVYDYPLTITEIEPLGDGWYAGRGRTQLRAIMYIPIAMRFDSLRMNVDYRQIGGAVEAITRDDAPNILNTDLIDDGGSTLLQGQPLVSIVPLGFALPSAPQFTFNPQTLEL